MNKKTKKRILEALIEEFQLTLREQYFTKKSILLYSKKLKYNESTILEKLRQSKRYGLIWIKKMNNKNEREEILEAEKMTLLCGKYL